MKADDINFALLEAMPCPVYLIDERCRVSRMNRKAEALSATLEKSGELPGAVVSAVADAIASGHDLVGDDVRRAVEILPVGTAASAVQCYVPQVTRVAGGAGTAASWIVVLSEAGQLRQRDAAKTKAMSSLGHELKTPVASIRMALHLLKEEKIGPLTEDQRELVAAGHEDCERLLLILQALLELARFESGRVELKLKSVSAESLLAPTGFKVDSPWSGLSDVMADAALVTRVLKIFGAVVLPTESTAVPNARVEEREKRALRFIVRRPLRRALTETECARMFEPFALKTENDPEKSGLGLALAREIALAQGGQVGVTSDETGTEFYLELPLARV